MIAARRAPLVLIALSIVAQLRAAQGPKRVTIKEPGIYELADLFKQADTVALVRIVAGDMEAYNVAIDKAETVQSFKGAAVGETIYFGPYVGERLGWEQILFLRNLPKPITPKPTSNAGYGTVHYSEIFNEGYTAMEVSHECVFEGKDIAQKCDYGVRVCTDYIKLPKSVPIFPPLTRDTPFGCRWARKAAFISVLEELGQHSK